MIIFLNKFLIKFTRMAMYSFSHQKIPAKGFLWSILRRKRIILTSLDLLMMVTITEST